MLLTLSATSLRSMLVPAQGGKAKLALLDLPAYARQTLGLHGVNISTDMLAGQSREQLEKLRDRADKAGAACLLLIEPEPQAIGSGETGAASVERLQRVVRAAHVLGCNSIAVRVAGADDPALLQAAADGLRKVAQRAEKLEINVLVAPTEGLTSVPERVTELIKKVGGFRVGTFPDFEAASASPDPVGYLRRLTPYASVVCASTVRFVEEKADPGDPEHEPEVRHTAFDIKKLTDAIISVGYDGTLAIEYRGKGDATLGVTRSRRLLEKLLDHEPEEEAR